MRPLSEIADLLGSPDEEVRREAVLSLEGKSEGDDVTELKRLLILGIQDESWRVRKTALDLLMQELDYEDYVRSLIELLHFDDKAGARNTAVEGLIRLGQKATSFLVEAFDSHNADVRKFIVDIIGEVADRNAAPLLVRALGDEDDNVRASAVEHLGSIKEPSVLDALIEILQVGDLWTAYPAAEALGKIGNTRAVPALIGALKNGMLREPVLRALGRLGDESVIDKIVPLIKDRSRAVQHMAIYALEELYHRGIPEDAITQGILAGLGERAVPILVEQAASAREEVKASSILLLGLLKDERALDPLLELAHEDEFTNDIRRALVSIGRDNPDALLHFTSFENTLMTRFVCNIYAEVASPTYFDTLMRYLDSEDGHVRSLAARGLGRIGKPEAVSSLKAHLTDEFEDVQEAVVKALEVFKGSLNLIELQKNMKSGNDDLRKNSVTLMGVFETEEALSSVCAALDDPSPMVRKSALMALSIRNSEFALQFVERALKDKDPYIRLTAAHILGETKNETFLKPVCSLLADSEDKVRVAAAKALGMIGSELAIGKLTDAMRDKNGFVVTSAVDAIGTIGGEKAKRSLIKALSHEEKEVQRAALHALSSYPDCEEIILPFLDDADWATRTVAAQSLGLSKKEQVLRELEKALDREEDAVVRKALMGALGDK